MQRMYNDQSMIDDVESLLITASSIVARAEAVELNEARTCIKDALSELRHARLRLQKTDDINHH